MVTTRFKIGHERATTIQKNRRSDSIVTNFYFTEPAWRLLQHNLSKTRRPFSRPTATATQPIGGARANAIWRDLSMNERELTRPRHTPASAGTSGRRLLIGGDPNSPWARRYRDLVTRHIGDMGGRDLLSEGELSLIRRASALECELEGMEARMSQGEQVNLELYGRL